LRVSSVLTNEALSAALDDALKSRRDSEHFNAELRKIDDKVKDPSERAGLKFALLVKVAVETFGTDPAEFDEIGSLVLLGPMWKVLGDDLRDFGLTAEIGAARQKAMVQAVYAVRRFLTQAGRLLPGYPPVILRPFGWIMEKLLPQVITKRRGRVAEAVALSSWYFQNHSRGVSLDDAARHISGKLRARGVRRTKEELIRYRDEIDCDNHYHTVQTKPTSPALAASAAKLAQWTILPPENHPARRTRKTTDPKRQRIYETLWLMVETVVECGFATDDDKTAAVDHAIDLVLDQVYPRPTVLLHPQTD
jgi:hypothetical protein